MAASNDKIYNAINDLRKELKADIKAVDDKVDKVMIAQAVDKTKIGTLIAGITIIVSSVCTVVVENIKRSIH